MTFLKKSLLLALFLEFVSFSICDDGKRQEGSKLEEEREVEDVLKQAKSGISLEAIKKLRGSAKTSHWLVKDIGLNIHKG
ncbi:hypothetical protein GDO81_027469 [Engystomops pustulosus]|uniref:Frog antimicrobial peptide propeptide domain-containing protein n=1 Tax=Engystomops pustulosus TaxID=76066 RepID=A0AAV6ZJX4_ENGPU|nr:hypothetical protein GDO81_027469 [Engystomops pustulosus]KAG8547799.1 hypothetical protein GDO81_027469 [Engystomops pustulosus]